MPSKVKTKKRTTAKKKPAAKGKRKKTKTKAKSANKLKKSIKNLKNNKRGVIAVVFCILTLIAVITGIAISIHNNSVKQHRLAIIDKDVAFGIDVSSHNGKIDWEEASQNIDFAFVRVAYRGYSNGNLCIDKRARQNLKNANKNDVPVGIYVYSQAINEEEAVEEADLALDFAAQHDITLPIVIDFEYAYNDSGDIDGRLHQAKLSKREATDLLNAFCKRIIDNGYVPAVYASSNVFKSDIYADELCSDAKIWVADYNKKVTYKGNYDFWQYSNKGSCPGVNSDYVDMNYWYTGKEN